jgi:hypothetical protein
MVFEPNSIVANDGAASCRWNTAARGKADGKEVPRRTGTPQGLSRPRKKSAQSRIYLIDREKIEWFKVGVSGVIWFTHPAHELSFRQSGFLRG